MRRADSLQRAYAERISLAGVLCLILASSPAVRAEGESSDPLHTKIDRAIDAAGSGVSAPPVSDAEFLRRASLDLIGVPPTTAEMTQFLADGSAGKRSVAIDRLLASPQFPRHLANVLDILLMERRPRGPSGRMNGMTT